MALISYYNQPVQSNKIDVENSPYTKAHTFLLKITTSSLDEDNLKNLLGGRTTITGIIEEIPQIAYSTTWGDSPVAVINEKVKKFTQDKWIKMFAQQHGDYRPPLVTDGWTQQIPKAAEPLNVSFKFRAYPIDGYYNTTIFTDIIKLLIFVTTPQQYALSHTMQYMSVAMKQSYKKGQKAGEIVEQLTDNLSNSNIDFSKLMFAMKGKDEDKLNLQEQDAMKAIGQLHQFMKELGDMNGDNVGGCPLIELSINGLIQSYPGIRWMLKSWSFKPALQVTFDNNPIYVDFNVTLQTQYILSSADLEKILL